MSEDVGRAAQAFLSAFLGRKDELQQRAQEQERWEKVYALDKARSDSSLRTEELQQRAAIYDLEFAEKDEKRKAEMRRRFEELNGGIPFDLQQQLDTTKMAEVGIQTERMRQTESALRAQQTQQNITFQREDRDEAKALKAAGGLDPKDRREKIKGLLAALETFEKVGLESNDISSALSSLLGEEFGDPDGSFDISKDPFVEASKGLGFTKEAIDLYFVEETDIGGNVIGYKPTKAWELLDEQNKIGWTRLLEQVNGFTIDALTGQSRAVSPRGEGEDVSGETIPSGTGALVGDGANRDALGHQLEPRQPLNLDFGNTPDEPTGRLEAVLNAIKSQVAQKSGFGALSESISGARVVDNTMEELQRRLLLGGPRFPEPAPGPEPEPESFRLRGLSLGNR